MSGDWFEEALSELDDADRENDSDIPSEDVETEDADTADEPSNADTADESGDGPVDVAGEPDDEPPDAESAADPFGFSAEDSADAGDDQDDRADPATQQPADSDEESEPSTASADEFDAGSDDTDAFDAGSDDTDAFDAGSDDTDAFGFSPESAGRSNVDSDPAADSGADAAGGFSGGKTVDEPTETPDPQPSEASSMAQSAEEFGFSLDEETPVVDEPPAQGGGPTPDTQAQSGGPTPDTRESEPSTADQPDDDDDPFGFGSKSAGGSTPAMGGDGDDDFGFGGFGGGGGGGGPSPSDSEEFDEEEFESDIDRIDLGIDGLDDMILGGVPERSLIGIIGGAGTGKTTFALQFLNQALEQDERAVFITLEQTEEAVLSTAEEKGWPFRQYVEDGMLTVVVLDPVEMANSLASIRGDISRLIREFGASRLVLDSVSLLEMMYDHPAKRRSEVFDFTRSLKDAGVTTLLTSEASKDSSHASRYGAVEYLTDAVFILQYVRTSNFEETRLAIEIQKIRDANHSRATKPYDLTDEGMSVHKQANIF